MLITLLKPFWYHSRTWYGAGQYADPPFEFDHWAMAHGSSPTIRR